MSWQDWLERRRSNVASATAVALLVGGLGIAVSRAEGVHAAHLEVDDGAVWVTNPAKSLVGRLNTTIRELTGAVTAASGDFDVRQSGSDVFVVDTGTGTLQRLGVADVALSGKVALPPAATVALGGSTVAVLREDTGALWVRSAADVLALDVTSQKPDAELGKGAAVAVGQDGAVHAVSVTRDEVQTIAAPGAKATAESLGVDVATATVTAVGDHAVVLDGQSRLIVPGRPPVTLAPATGAVLQQPGPEAADIAVATNEGLDLVPVAGGAARRIPGGTGRPAAPVRVAGCVHAAWSGTPTYTRVCDNQKAVTQPVPSAGADTQLQFRVNRQSVALNDVATGGVWTLEDAPRRVDDWQDVIPPKDDQGKKSSDSDESDTRLLDAATARRGTRNHPPVAVNDDFGIRPGRMLLLPVLDNDSDPDGDVLTVSLDDDVPGARVVEDGREVEYTARAGSTGRVVLHYTVSDGRGGSAHAQIAVDVHPLTENAPPEQKRRSATLVEQGKSVTYRVLQDWIDPDGDDIFLKSAATSPGGTVRHRPDGTITYIDAGTSTGRRQVQVVVSDGTASTTGSLSVLVRPRGELPPTAENDHYATFVDETAVFAPLQNDTDPNDDPLRLTKVTGPAGTVVHPDFEAGTFTFSAHVPGSYYVTYIVTDGPSTATGLVRVDVSPRAGTSPPVAVRDMVLLPYASTAVSDVLANDYDADGDVLVVQSAAAPGGSGLKVSVLQHRLVRVTATQDVTSPQPVQYVVSDGTTAVHGSLLVVPVLSTGRNQPPLARPDTATVRVGDVVNIPVLANDEDPDGDPLTLAPNLAEGVPSTAGLMTVDRDRLRFEALDRPGTVHAVYTVTDSQHQAASAQVTIRVVPRGRNSPPAPLDVVARVSSGRTVHVPVPLDGIDPDGDAVTLASVSGGGKGRVSGQGPDWIDYTADPESMGTDTLTYAVQDTSGATGTATLRVGIAPLPRENQAPVALDDKVQARPGRHLQIAVLGNDSDPDGDPVSIIPDSLRTTAPVRATLTPAGLELTTPSRPATLTYEYAVSDGRGGSSSAFVTVTVLAQAPLQAPVARDDVLGPADIAGKTTVDVKVLTNDDDPDGSRADLTLALAPGQTTTATVTPARSLRVRPSAARQIIAYRVTDRDGLSATSFVVVPAAANLPPVRRAGAPRLSVKSGATLTIPLASQVSDPEGKPVRLTESSSVSATHGNGASLVEDAHTLRFTPAPGFAGTASISFEVTDGTGPSDPAGRRASFTLPIEVTRAGGTAPSFPGATLTVPPGGSPVSIDLRSIARDPDPGDPARLVFRGPRSVPPALHVRLSGGILSVSAAPDAHPGTTATLALTVSDGSHAPVAAPVKVVVTATTAPPPHANDDTVEALDQGKSVTVRVLANDLNPFPGKPLKLLSASLVSGGGTVTSNAETVTYTAGADTVGVVVVRYRMTDATGDAARASGATLTITVRGKPEAPAAPTVQEVRDHTVVLTWPAPADNGSPITRYLIRGPGGYAHTCTGTTCTLGDLHNDVEYQFTVAAVNAVGSSAPSARSATARPDVRPDRPEAPALTSRDGSLDVAWTAPASPGSAVTSYDLEISPPVAGGGSVTVPARTTYHWSGLSNGQSYRVRIRAHNKADQPSDWSDYSASEVPAGVPNTPAAPVAAVDGGEIGGQVKVSWAAPSSNGAAITGYVLEVLKNGAHIDTVTVSSDAKSQTVSAQNAQSYTFRVSARNKAGLSRPSESSAAVQPFGKPDRIASVTASPRDRAAQLSFGAPDSNGQAITRYEYKAGGSVGTISNGIADGLDNGTTYAISVRACNTYCGDWSDPANSVVPFGPPLAPNVNIAVNGIHLTYSWSPPAPNGRPIVSVEFSVDGAPWTGTDPSKSIVGDYAGGETHTIRVRAVDSEGQRGTEANASARTADRSIDVFKGAVYTGTIDDGTGRQVRCINCYHVNINLHNFAPNHRYDLPGTAIDSGHGGGFRGFSVTTDGDGNYSGPTGTAVFGYSTWISVTIDGVTGRANW